MVQGESLNPAFHPRGWIMRKFYMRRKNPGGELSRRFLEHTNGVCIIDGW
jgi:hypothetical protein